MKQNELDLTNIIGTIWITPRNKSVYMITKYLSGSHNYVITFLSGSKDEAGTCIGGYDFSKIITMIGNDKYIGNIEDLDLDSLIAERLYAQTKLT